MRRPARSSLDAGGVAVPNTPPIQPSSSPREHARDRSTSPGIVALPRRRLAVGRAAAAIRPGALRRAPLAADRPVSRWSHGGGDGRAGSAQPLLHRRQQRRRMADHGLRAHLDAAVRRPADRLDRRARGRPGRSQRHLRRQRRRAAAPRPLGGRRDLQIRRRGTDLAPRRPGGRPADPGPRRRPARCASRPGSRARPPLWRQYRARRVPLDRRRGVVAARALQG